MSLSRPFLLAPPAGMSDLLPPDAAARGALGGKLKRLFARYGYDLVTTPPFEHAEVLERGLDTLDRRDLLRFVEPETGEVALLRPDITPQIARIVATRLADRPPPFRLAYSGSLIRRRRGRARRQRQTAQAGVECIGLEGIEGDAEVIGLAAEALSEVGLEDFQVELYLVPLVRGALAELPEAARAAAAEALSRKDRHALEATLRQAAAGARLRRQLLGASELYGEVEVLREATRLFSSAPAKQALAGLGRLAGLLGERGLGPKLSFDLGEVRGMAYYTGPSFTILAPGPGEPVGSGGRYDGLLGRFGLHAPATGFGLDLGHLEWAMAEAGVHFDAPRAPRFVVAGGGRARRDEVAATLRQAGVDAAVIPARGAGAALDYARAWGYEASLVLSARGDVLWRRDGSRRSPGALNARGIEALVRWAQDSKE